MREELERIDQFAVGENFVMEMRTGRAAGRSDESDHGASLDVLARPDGESAQMAVPRRQFKIVLEDDQIAVVPAVARRFDNAVRGGEDR